MKTFTDLFPKYKDRNIGDKVILSLYYLRVRIEQNLERNLEPYNISAVQYRTLAALREKHPNGSPIYNLRQYVNESKGTSDVSRLLSRLTKAGLVKKKKNRKDKREILAFLTPKGIDLIDTIVNTRGVLDVEVENLTEKDAHKLYDLLQILVDKFTTLHEQATESSSVSSDLFSEEAK